MTSSRILNVGDPGSSEQLPVAELLDADFVRSALQEQVPSGRADILALELEHVRYVPRVSLVTSYVVTYRTAHAPKLRSRLYCKASTADAFARALERARGVAWVESPLLSAPVQCPGLFASMLEFPNDARLPHLSLLEPKRLAALLGQFLSGPEWTGIEVHSQLLRYKPETRCVARVVSARPDGTSRRSMVIRIERPEKAAVSRKLLAWLHHQLDGDPLLGVAPPLFAMEAQGVSAVEWIDGEPLSERMSKVALESEMARLGTALARLHEIPAPPWQTDDRASHLIRARRSVEHLSTSAAHEEAAWTLWKSLVDLDSKSEADTTVLTHGDFHQGQVVVGQDKLWFLDVDRARVSEAAADAGSFLAHLHLLELKDPLNPRDTCAAAFLAGYHSRAQRRLGDRRLQLWTAAGLLELAAKQLRRLRPGWQQRTSEILGRALDVARSEVSA